MLFNQCILSFQIWEVFHLILNVLYSKNIITYMNDYEKSKSTCIFPELNDKNIYRSMCVDEDFYKKLFKDLNNYLIYNAHQI